MPHKPFRQLAIFAAIGLLNTTLDTAVYVVLRGHHVPLVPANIVSTSLALCLSFILNRKFTFQIEQSGRRTYALFALVTLSGLWILQPLIIYAANHVLATQAVRQGLTNLGLGATHWTTLFAKLTAIPFTLAWNFTLYKKVVFKEEQGTQTDALATKWNVVPDQGHNQPTIGQQPDRHYRYRPTRRAL